MIITINGRPGSGKSAVTSGLAKELRFSQIDMGKIRRRAIHQSGKTLLEFNQWALTHPDAGDKVFDRLLVREVRQKRNVVVSSRTAFHFFPHAFNVYLDVSPLESAKRIFKSRAGRHDEKTGTLTLQSTRRFVAQRVREERIRYRKLYGVDIFDKKNYTYALDTTKIPIPKVIQLVRMAFLDWSKQKKKKR
jgi:CMP/dCMP kinase